jgi:energy-coupling factor transporter ATP-binding protein EcfA2
MTNTNNNIKNILLIGKTGNGKSALANVISGGNNLKEGEFGVSETKDVQIAEFEIYEERYRIIDTIGIGDTELSLQKVLYKLARMSNYVKEGLNQVLFVNSGKFTEEEISTYNLLRKFIFDEEIERYTTIVRTNFPNFRNDDKCKEDIEKMIRNGGELTELICNCRNRIIHIDNSPINVEDEDEVAINKRKRERSRTILLTYLAKCEEVYQPRNLHDLNERISNYMTEEEKLKKRLDELNNQNQSTNKEIETLKEEISVLKEQIESLHDQVLEEMVEHIENKEQGFFERIDKGLGRASD